MDAKVKIPGKRGRPLLLSTERAMAACKYLPEILGRPARGADLARLFSIPEPTARRALIRAAQSVLAAAHDAQKPTAIIAE